MRLQLYINRCFPVEWPEDCFSSFKKWLKQNKFTKDDSLVIVSDIEVVGQNLASMISAMGFPNVISGKNIRETLPTFCCTTDVGEACPTLQNSFVYTKKYRNQLHKNVGEILYVHVLDKSPEERHKALEEAAKWQEENPTGIVISDLPFSGTYPKEVLRVIDRSTESN